jgi:hypothetical protein
VPPDTGPRRDDLTALLRLRTSPEQDKAWLRIDPGWHKDDLSLQAVQAFLSSKAVELALIDEPALHALLRDAHATPDASHEALIAVGAEPLHGSPGSFQWAADVALAVEQAQAHARRVAEARDSTGREDAPADPLHTDHYASSPFVIVRRGQLLGRLLRPTLGEDGRDVFGAVIPARAGPACPIRLDDTVERARSGAIHAAIDGLLLPSADSLAIEPTLAVRGEVAFATGHIDFPGDVDIAGGVKDRFRVHAAGTLRVAGLAEACTLSALGAITLDRGMAGRGLGTLRAAADVEARYLEAVPGVIGGDLRVRGEITNCSLLIEGRLDAAGCAVRGGEILASRGATVGSLGSTAGAPTVLSLGRLPGADELLTRADEMRPELDAAITRLRATRDALKRIPRPGHDDIERLMDAEFRLTSLTKAGARMEQAAGQLVAAVHQYAFAELNVRSALFRKVTILLPGWRAEITADHRGPARVHMLDGEPALTNPDSGETRPLRSIATVVRADAAGRSFTHANAA